MNDAKERLRRANERLVRLLAERSSELRTLLDEHTAANHGELLSHLYMGEVTEWLVNAHADGREHDVRDVLQFLEEQFEGDEDVRELIAVSFLENLPFPGEPQASVRALLPPALRDELQRLESHYRTPPTSDPQSLGE
jgi:hypothetical protein